MPEIQTLNISGGSIDDSNMHHLLNCKKLSYLNVGGTKVTSAGFKGFEKMPIKGLCFGGNRDGDLLAQYTQLAASLPNVTSLSMPDFGKVTEAEVRAVAQAFPELKSFSCHRTSLEVDISPAFEHFENLESLTLSETNADNNYAANIIKMKKLRSIYLGSSQFGDAGLEKLSEHRKLGTVNVKNCTNVTNAGAERFRKKNRDVILER